VPLKLAFAALFLWGAFALGANLGETYLWDDEAETALLAQSILAAGVPKALVNGQWVREDSPPTRNHAGIWVWNTWFSLYLAAASFKILGVSTFSARLPFALAGLLSLLLSLPVFRKITKDPFTAALGAGLMATSVPYLLYVRQCHYYLPADDTRQPGPAVCDLVHTGRTG
jgi:4-amino-4-deoxy-L-arabinose transferase-like glycosyltransferase